MRCKALNLNRQDILENETTYILYSMMEVDEGWRS